MNNVSVCISRKTRLLKSVILFCFLGGFPVLSAKTYFVDSRNGNDASAGTLPSGAWKSLEKINSQKFTPGDTICFARGSEWTGTLTISSPGTESRPVVFTAYGKGQNPVIKNRGTDRAVAIKIGTDWIIVENFLMRDCHAAGISIEHGAKHNIVRYNEATKVGAGFTVNGPYNLITKNYAHDLLMVVNDPGGDNDYGAVGVTLQASGNVVSYNRMINCRAPSMDYGFDGGVVEFYGNVDSCYVHHNYAENCDGSFEVGGNRSTLLHNIIAYNICVNNGNSLGGGFHISGKFGVTIRDMRVENNVFADTSHNDYAIGFWGGAPKVSDFLYRNNIFYIPNFERVSNESSFTHENNIYYLGGKMNTGITVGRGDKIADPLFRNFNARDFHLKAGSPAIDAGANLNYSIDFDGNAVPQGSAPDIGAFEYSGK
jgi:hypothetical protein